MRKPERLSSGRYKVRFRGPRKKGGWGETSEMFDSLKAAREFCALLDALGPQGAIDHLWAGEQQAAVPSLDTVAAEWIALRPNTTDGTRLNYERLWARTWGRLIGFMPANRITEDDLARAAIELGRTYSRKSLENQRGLLSGVVGRAVRQGHLDENIARGMPLPAGVHNVNAGEMRILTVEEFATVDERVPDHYQPAVRTLYASGLRWGELVSLEVRDWRKVRNPQTGEILGNLHVRQALKWSPDNKRVIGAPKTRSGARTVTITDELHDALDALADGRAGDEMLFTAPRGGPLLHRTFWSRVWLPAVSHLTPRPRIHDLRHSHASLLLARGIPIHVVSRRLGHSNIQVTVNTYGHLLPDAQLLAAQASSFAFAPSPAELT